MTKIKICGLSRECDIDYANAVMPDYIGFVFAKGSRRYVTYETAKKLRQKLKDGITAVGVFTDEPPENVERLVKDGVIDVVQLHGNEDDDYIEKLRARINCPIIQAFGIKSETDTKSAKRSIADYIMLDSGGGTGMRFNHSLIKDIKRDFFLAGGLDSENVADIISEYNPFAVDASSSLETDGVKDEKKIAAFVNAVRYGGKRND